MLEFKVIGYTPVYRGELQGFVDVLLEPIGLVLRGIRHVKKSGRNYLQQPCKWARNGRAGVIRDPIRMFDFVRLEDHRKFQQEVLEQLQARTNGQNGKEMENNGKIIEQRTEKIQS